MTSDGKEAKALRKKIKVAVDIFEYIKRDGYEQLNLFYEPSLNLRLVVSIHNTFLGSSVGGLRMWPFPTEEEAIIDCLRLAKAMTYKAAAAGLDAGGGKAVVVADPKTDKSKALFQMIGRFINSLSGRFIMAEDVGITMEDIKEVHETTDFVVGLPESMGGGGDPSGVTAYGVFEGMRAPLEEIYGSDSFEGRTIAIQGVGKVGYPLARRLHEAAADLIISDIDEQKLSKVSKELGARCVSPDAIYDSRCDIFTPSALGGIINKKTISRLRCRIIAGPANNQLEETADGDRLHQKGILYAPDYIINAGGLINVVDELKGYNRERVLRKTREIYNTIKEVIAISRKENLPTYKTADRIAERRLAESKKEIYFRK